jgi:hypothetical protein
LDGGSSIAVSGSSAISLFSCAEEMCIRGRACNLSSLCASNVCAQSGSCSSGAFLDSVQHFFARNEARALRSERIRKIFMKCIDSRFTTVES